MTTDNMTFFQSEARAEIRKAADALSRALDGLDVSELDDTSLRYSNDQITKALAWASAAREALEGLISLRGMEHARDLARRRLADPAYTPSAKEAILDMDGFMEGFREG